MNNIKNICAALLLLGAAGRSLASGAAVELRPPAERMMMLAQAGSTASNLTRAKITNAAPDLGTEVDEERFFQRKLLSGLIIGLLVIGAIYGYARRKSARVNS